MRDPRDYKLDLSSVPAEQQDKPSSAQPARPFISVHFACCNVFLRIFRSADGKGYRGHCPRCARPVNFEVGSGGTDQRIFRVE